MKIIVKSLVIIAVFFSVGCISINHPFDFDKDIDFSSYMTFSWMSEIGDKAKDSDVKNTIIEKRFQQSILEELENKNFIFNDVNPDFIVAFHSAAKENHNMSCTYHDHDHGYRFFGGGISLRGGFGVDSCYTYSKDQVLITIDIVDAKNNELLWRGWQSDLIHGPTILEETIRKAVRGILKNFPPVIK